MIHLLKNKNGNVVIAAPVIMLLLFTMIAFTCEYTRVQSTAAGTRDAVQAALTQVCTDNSNNVYPGVREGYSGGYKLVDTSWAQNVSTGDILSKLDAKLGTTDGVKSIDGKTYYEISDISVNIQNAPIAPSSSDDSQRFTGSATYTVTVPLQSAWSALPPIVIPEKVESGYSPQGPVDTSGNSDTETQVTGVSLSASEMTLDKGDTQVIAASVTPDDATDRKISWTSTDSSVASVTQTGAVTGLSNGSASIVALSDSGQMATCSVTVVSPVTGVSLDKISVTMIKGATESLTATVHPTNATNQGVQWATSDTSVCTVDSSGVITAVGAGNAMITVMTQEGGFYAECTVTVKIPVTGLTLDKTAETIAKGATDTLTATVYPSDASRPDVLWASSDTSVCTVDQTGNITAVGVGSAVISATTEDGDYVATCTINVVIPVTGITVSPAVLTLIKGKTGTITATVSPSDATDKTVFWTSTDSNIASVSSSGIVSANNVGTATITAKTEDGGYTASCSVTVKPNTYTVTVVSGSGGTATGGGVYNAGSTVTLTETPDAHYHFVSWETGNGTVLGTGATYTISSLNADTTIYANFAIDTFTVTVNGSAGGTATGGGIYAYGTVITLTASPDSNYHFLAWSDGSIENPRNYTVTQNVTITATFKKNPITWTEVSTIPDYQNSNKTLTLYTNMTDCTASTTVVDQQDNSSNDANGNVIYTFTTPLTLPAGTTINVNFLVSGNHDYESGSTNVYLDGTQIVKSLSYTDSREDGSTNGIVYSSYTVSSPLTINSVTGHNSVHCKKNAWTTGTLKVAINLPDGTSFMLNSTNTSDGQS